MVWRLFATKLETAETMEGVALNMRAPYFYPTSTQISKKSKGESYCPQCMDKSGARRPGSFWLFSIFFSAILLVLAGMLLWYGHIGAWDLSWDRLIGRKGAMPKKIGTEARPSLETFFATRVFLELFVKVCKDWSRDARMLKEFGYGEKS